MNHELRTKSGLTLIEMTLVIAIAALLITIAVPAVRAVFRSFESEGSAKSMISSALASARAIAAKNQRYAGIRFQKAYHPKGPLEAPQYMIFIMQDPDMMAYGFRAVPGLKPIKLPDSVGVMDLRIRTNPNPIYAGDEPIDTDSKIEQTSELQDTTSFSVIFSPSGKLVIHNVRVRNRDGYPDTASNTNVSSDDVFNKKTQVDAGLGMFYQDDYADLGLGTEASRNSFVIYEREKFRQTYRKGTAWSEYLVRLAPQAIYINPYTGTIISSKQ
jgi:prepilin-type N-terminal cleavage/methylation domain-containing protein